MGVLSGLSAACINRLKYTKSEVPQKIVQIQVEIERQMSSSNSFKTYRSELRQFRSTPTIPFL